MVPRWPRLARTITNSDLTRMFFMSPRLRGYLQGMGDPFTNHVWVYAAVSAIVRNIQGVPWLIKRGSRAASQGVDSGPWVNLFDAPNLAMSEDQFWEAVVIHYETAGCCMIVKEGRGDGPIAPGEMPLELWPVSGDLFEPVVDKRDAHRLLGWNLDTQGRGSPTAGGKIFLLPHQVVRIYRVDPASPFGHLSPLRSTIRSIRRDYKADTFDEAFFDNAAIPGGVVIAPDGTTPDQEEEIRRQKEDRHAGASKAFRLMILSGATQFIPAQETHRDMQFLEMRGWDREAVLAVYGVPPEEVGIDKGNSIITGQGALSSNRGFWQRTLIPAMRSFNQAFTSQLIAPVDPTYFGEFDFTAVPAMQPDLTAALTHGRELQRMGYTLNQVNDRLGLGMEKVGWGNTPFMDASLITVEDAAAPMPDIDDEEAQEPEPDAEEEPGRAVTRATATADADYWQRVAVETLFPMQSTFKGKWTRHLMTLRAHQLNRLKEANPKTRAEVKAALFGRDTWDAKAQKALRPVYEKAIDRAANGLAKELGVKIKLTDKEKARIVAAQERVLVIGHRTLHRRLMKKIGQGLDAGETGEALLDRARQAFNITAKRAGVSAMEEVSGVVNRARLAVMKKAGITHHRWIVQSGNPRPTHAAQHATAVPVGQKFPNGLRYPQDQAGESDEICGCQCVTQPVLPEDWDEQPVTEIASTIDTGPVPSSSLEPQP